jgi:hypothetical protein
MKGNLTLRLEKSVIRKAKLLSAARGMSVSALLAAYVERELRSDAEYEKAMRTALALMKRGFHLGGKRTWTREDLYDRAVFRR